MTDTTDLIVREGEGDQFASGEDTSTSTWIGATGVDRLSQLMRMNRNCTFVNHDIYRVLYKRDLYVIAYERIKSNPGNMTEGVDGRTLDGFSRKQIEETISQLREQKYRFTRARRVYIPKKSGKLRPLGIPAIRDKLVQEVIRMILEAIYDGEIPTFSENSHGFRKNRGTHSCFKQVHSYNWNAISWFIEGDIKACFDEIDHCKLLELLSKRIDDNRFIELIGKALKAGYLEGLRPFDPLRGSPQGSIVSPMLANIYLHELDIFVEEIIQKYDTGLKHKRVNPAYTKIIKEIGRIKRGKIVDKAYKKGLILQMRNTPSKMDNDPKVIRIKYVRYADDWLIGLDGPISLAKSIKKEIAIFLQDKLKLTLSDEKTHIRNARTEEAFFLGARLQVGGRAKGVKIKKIVNKNGLIYKKRVTGTNLHVLAPIELIVKKLSESGYCDGEGTPKAYLKMFNNDHAAIITHFNSVLWGILNYYSHVNNYKDLKRIQFILQYSAIKTLCRKHQCRISQMIKKHGVNLKLAVRNENGKTVKEYKLKLQNNWKSNISRFIVNKEERDIFQRWMNYHTRTKLFCVCCICESNDDVQMHHIRHARKGEHKGFNKILAALNRKQIPVCLDCHTKIHYGKYDGLSLKEFARAEIAAR